MIKEIRIYIEGGDNKSKRQLRIGFNEFFRSITRTTREKGIRWKPFICGNANNTLNQFKIAYENHNSETFIIFLIDSDNPIQSDPLSFTLQKKPDLKSSNIDEECCHFMVQIMESWFVADIEALKNFYGSNFLENAIPRQNDVESIKGNELLNSLKKATRKTQKGKYHKIQHAYKLLGLIDVNLVRGKAPHCDRLFKSLEKCV